MITSRRAQYDQIYTLCDSDEFRNSISIRGNIPPEKSLRFIQLFQTALRTNPDLLGCDVASLRLAAERMAEDNLSPLPGAGQVSLFVDKKGKCQYMPTWRGEAIMAIRRNGLRALTADIVYKGEPFKCSKGGKHSIEHELNLDIPRTKENIYAFYAVAVYPDGTQIVEVMSLAEVEHVRATYSPRAKSKKPSEAWQIDAWRDSFDQMGRKTVIKRLCKHLNREKSDQDEWLNKLPQSTQDMEEAEEIEVYCQTEPTHDEHTEYEIVQPDEDEEEEQKEIENPIPPTVKKLGTKPIADKPVFNTGNLYRDLLHAYSRAIQEKIISSMQMKDFINKHGVKDLNDIPEDIIELELDRLNELFAEIYCDPPAMVICGETFARANPFVMAENNEPHKN